MSLKWDATQWVTEANFGKYRSPYRPMNEALTAANEHAAHVRHRNRARRRWPFRGFRRRR